MLWAVIFKESISIERKQERTDQQKKNHPLTLKISLFLSQDPIPTPIPTQQDDSKCHCSRSLFGLYFTGPRKNILLPRNIHISQAIRNWIHIKVNKFWGEKSIYIKKSGDKDLHLNDCSTRTILRANTQRFQTTSIT